MSVYFFQPEDASFPHITNRKFFTVLLVEDQCATDAAKFFNNTCFFDNVDLVVCTSFVQGAFIILQHPEKLDGLILDVDLTLMQQRAISAEQAILARILPSLPFPKWKELFDSRNRKHISGGLYLWNMTAALGKALPTLFYSGHGDHYDAMLRPQTLSGQVQYLSKIFALDAKPTSSHAVFIQSEDGYYETLRDRLIELLTLKGISASSIPEGYMDFMVAATCQIAGIDFKTTTDESAALKTCLNDLFRGESFNHLKENAERALLPSFESAQTPIVVTNIPQAASSEERDAIKAFMKCLRKERTNEIAWMDIPPLNSCDGFEPLGEKLIGSTPLQQIFPEVESAVLIPLEMDKWFDPINEGEALRKFFTEESPAKIGHDERISDADWAQSRVLAQARIGKVRTRNTLLTAIDRKDRDAFKAIYHNFRGYGDRLLMNRSDQHPICVGRFCDPFLVDELMQLVENQIGSGSVRHEITRPDLACNARMIFLGKVSPTQRGFQDELIRNKIIAKEGCFARIAELALGYARVVLGFWENDQLKIVDLHFPRSAVRYSYPDVLQELGADEWFLDIDFEVGGLSG